MPQKSIMFLLSDFVRDLLEMLSIPEEQIKEELIGNMEVVKNVEKPEELMIHLSTLAKKIIHGENIEDSLEPTPVQIRQ